MKLKVCGLKYEKNIAEVVACEPDFIGHIFYKKSPRYVGNLDVDFVRNISGVKKVGIFVNASATEIVSKVKGYGLDLIQLHGDENLEMIKGLHAKGLEIIKVFRVSNTLPPELSEFVPYIKYCLFDTWTSNFGGSGQHFDWRLLADVSHPFFISGGIQIGDIETIKKLESENLAGIDVNSRFEIRHGWKDVDKIKKLKYLL